MLWLLAAVVVGTVSVFDAVQGSAKLPPYSTSKLFINLFPTWSMLLISFLLPQNKFSRFATPFLFAFMVKSLHYLALI